MSKLEDLLIQKEAVNAARKEYNENYKTELINIEKLENELRKEFERKVKSWFRGVKVEIACDKDYLSVYIGNRNHTPLLTSSGVRILDYSKDYYNCDTDIMVSDLGTKIKELYIEYYGEL